MSTDGERRARVALSFLAKPGDPVLGAALRARTPMEVLALVTGADVGGAAVLAGQPEDAALGRAVERWRTGSATSRAPRDWRPGRTAVCG